MPEYAIAVLAACALPAAVTAALVLRGALWDEPEPTWPQAAGIALLAAAAWPWVWRDTIAQLRKGGRT